MILWANSYYSCNLRLIIWDFTGIANHLVAFIVCSNKPCEFIFIKEEDEDIKNLSNGG